MNRREHWERVYLEKEPEAVSWYTPRLATSIELIDALGPGPGTRVIDVGGGASTLPDHLLDLGAGAITVLDLSAAALARSRARLGRRADRVTWIEADIRAADLPEAAYDIWHDRAAFHFLTDANDRARYAAVLHHALAPGGQVVLATFALDGPERCSGLPVQRYDAPAMAAALGLEGRVAFEVVDERHEVHTTPWASTQAFQFAVLRRV